MNDGVDAVSGQAGVHKLAQFADAQRQQILQRGAENVEGQPEDQEHHADENGNGKVFVRQDAVEAHAAQMLLAFLTFNDGFRAKALNIIVAHGGDRGVSVQLALCFHFYDAVLQHFQLVLIQLQTLNDICISLDDLSSGKTAGDAGGLRMILDQMRDGVNTAVYRAIAAEIHPLRRAAFPDGLNGNFDQFIYALVLRRGDGNNGNSQFTAHGGDVDGAAVAANLVHHVEREHHGDLHFQKLERQVEIPLDVGGVHNVDDAVRLFVQDEIPCDNLFAGVGPHGIDPRQIDHGAALRSAQFTGFAVHRDAGKVSDMLIGAGELIEQRDLAAVLISDKREYHQPVTSGRMSIFAASSRRRVSS